VNVQAHSDEVHLQNDCQGLRSDAQAQPVSQLTCSDISFLNVSTLSFCSGYLSTTSSERNLRYTAVPPFTGESIAERKAAVSGSTFRSRDFLLDAAVLCVDTAAELAIEIGLGADEMGLQAGVEARGKLEKVSKRVWSSRFLPWRAKMAVSSGLYLCTCVVMTECRLKL